jgi:hypothetical protein
VYHEIDDPACKVGWVCLVAVQEKPTPDEGSGFICRECPVAGLGVL